MSEPSDVERKKIEIVLNQTNYTEAEAIQRLYENNMDEISVIKKYLGVPERKQEPPKKSLQQEIYKQLRLKMNESIRDVTPYVPVEDNE
jgi:hypothetical protein